MTTPGGELPTHLSQSCANCDRKLFGFFHAPRHQCRMCGDLFCDECTNQKALIPPSSIALVPTGCRDLNKPSMVNTDPPLSPPLVNGNLRVNSSQEQQQLEQQQQPKRQSLSQGNYLPIDTISEHDEGRGNFSYATDDTFLSEEEEFMKGLVYSERISLRGFPLQGGDNRLEDLLSSGLSFETSSLSTDLSYANVSNRSQRNIPSKVPLYGQGLEERMKLAREPLRVCTQCHSHLQHLQEELRNCNSNAVRYNSINPTGLRRLVNSPMAFTLGHEIRKAAYTLSNLLPMHKRIGAFESFDGSGEAEQGDGDCEGCRNIVGNFSNVDGVRIPAKLLEKAKGVAFLTVIKGGLGFTGFEFGTGLVVSRLPDETWSPPCAIGTAGISWGALVGIALSDHVLLLMTDDAVNVLSSNEGSVRLGADVGVAVGPIGRTVEANVGSGGGVTLAPIYTYSFSKGFYMGVSFDGKVIITRHGVNEKFYGHKVDSRALLSGEVPTPPAAQPLYDALQRCHAYANSSV